MPRTALFKAVLVVLMLLLAVPSAQAAEPGRNASSGLVAWDLLSQLWDFLTSAWTIEPDNGCHVDPDGACLFRESPTVESDNGCRVDPSGCES